MLRLLTAARGGGSLTPPSPPPSDWANAASIAADLEALFPVNAFNVVVGGVTQTEATMPAQAYNFLYPRDHAYTLWHYPTLFTASQRRTFVTYLLSRRSAGNLVADHMDGAGNVAYSIEGTPVWDGIYFLVLALWADWDLTGDTTTFVAQQSAIDDCLAAIPRAANGCVTRAIPGSGIDYGFADRVPRSGDVAYGTALQAWSYKMCAEMAGEAGSGTYTTLRAAAESGLATLRNASGWYKGSSGDQAGVDDVWATALIVAEGLVSGTDRTDSATVLRDAYLANQITQSGFVRPLPIGQNWAGYTYTALTDFQNGGFWPTPLWDCYRAVNLVDSSTARAWVQEALNEIETEIAALGATHAPYEWKNGAGAGATGYTCHAALVHRFV